MKWEDMHFSGVLKSDVTPTDPDPASIVEKDGEYEYALAKDMQKAFFFKQSVRTA